MCRPDYLLASPAFDIDPIEAAKKKDQKQLPSGFERRKNLVQVGLLSLSIFFGCIYLLNLDIPVNSQFCDTTTSANPEQECRRPDLVAYKATSLAAMCIMGLTGVLNWHLSPQARQLAKATPEDRLFGYWHAADYQNVIILCWQVFDFGMAFAIPENIDPIFLVHHILAMITAYCSLEYQMMSYYSIFYGGCSEFSSIFLVFLDKDGIFPITPGSTVDQFVLVCKGLFFLTFSYYRIFGWIYYSVTLWKDCHAVIASKSIEQQRPGKTLFLRLFQGLDLVLGALQCYWYYGILMQLAALFR
jgi:TLC domain